MKEEKIITLATYTYQHAQVVKSVFDAKGIECFLQNANLIQGAVTTGVKIKINESDFPQAMKILEAIELPVIEKEVGEKKVGRPAKPKVLFPVDFSDYSEKAGQVALDWALKLKAELTVIHVYFAPSVHTLPFPDTFFPDDGLDERLNDIETQANENMNKFVESMKAKNGKRFEQIVVKHHLLKGVAEDEILAFSNEYKPTVVIMGTRGKDRKAADLIGSVTAEVAEKAHVPVLAIPEDFDYRGIDNIKNILYATNFEKADFMALKKLESIVAPLNVKIFFVHVGSQKDEKKWDMIKLEELKSYIAKLVPEVEVSCDLIEAENFWLGLERYVQREKIDIISFTTHRRSLVTRLLYSNVERKMLYQTNTPLLVFHS
ncbi:MAG: universal stress protein [Cytophagaceae bacterium]|jgi:nucleotide-binding universal stress UspA family protein|nr:universal stress protein [Cytophagaceae bacterium]